MRTSLVDEHLQKDHMSGGRGEEIKQMLWKIARTKIK